MIFKQVFVCTLLQVINAASAGKLRFVLSSEERTQNEVNISDCGQKPADIVFLLDSSGSIGLADFKTQLLFVANFSETFEIGPKYVQVGVVTFATLPHNEFNLNRYNNKGDLVNAIRNIRYIAGSTRTDLALQYVETNSFTTLAGDRELAANILIVITDGQSSQPTLTLAEDEKMHRMNFKVFAIGIGPEINETELLHIATDAHHVFTVSNFDALSTLQAELRQTACKVNGVWSEWGTYTHCTLPCNGGSRSRVRSCTNPSPALGGNNCTGIAKEIVRCNEQPCPTALHLTTPTTATISFPTCNQRTVVTDLATNVKTSNLNASACPSNSYFSPEAFVLGHCSVRESSTWKAGENVYRSCASIPVYTPVATFDHGVYTSAGGLSGVFFGCLQHGFKVAVQYCDEVPVIEFITNGGIYAMDPHVYFTIT